VTLINFSVFGNSEPRLLKPPSNWY